MSIKGCTTDVLVPGTTGHQSECCFPVLMRQNGSVVLNQCHSEGFNVPDVLYFYLIAFQKKKKKDGTTVSVVWCVFHTCQKRNKMTAEGVGAEWAQMRKVPLFTTGLNTHTHKHGFHSEIWNNHLFFIIWYYNIWHRKPRQSRGVPDISRGLIDAGRKMASPANQPTEDLVEWLKEKCREVHFHWPDSHHRWFDIHLAQVLI